MADHDPALSRLLAGRGSMSRPEREQIFDAVWTGVSGEEVAERAESRRSWFGIALAFAAAAVLLGAVSLVPAPEDDSAFGVRGFAAGPVVTLLCGGSARTGSCPSGSELSFEVGGATQWSHVALFSRRSDDTVIWYAPATEEDRSEPIEAGVETALVPRTVELGPEHPPGRYEVTAVFSREPLSREDIRRRFTLPNPGPDVIVVEQELVVR